MRWWIVGSVGVAFLLAVTGAGLTGGHRIDDRLIEVARSTHQWTGVAVSREGRIFVNFPRWSANVPISVAELDSDGNPRPYPDQTRNDWPGKVLLKNTAERFICVQSVYVDDDDSLWVLDPANPRFQGVVPGGAKLIQFDLNTNQPIRTIVFTRSQAPPKSYLNDVRVDTRRQVAYITDSGMGAILVVDLKSGRVLRRLENHSSVHAERYVPIIGGKNFPREVHSDGLALSDDGKWLYFQALTARTLHRVPTDALRDPNLSEADLGETIETYGHWPGMKTESPWIQTQALPPHGRREIVPYNVGASDGFARGPGGNILLTSLERDAISRVTSSGPQIVLHDSRLQWPDSLAVTDDGWVYVTTSKIHINKDEIDFYGLYKFRAR
jgi:sugar lactone lactonase YvrE